MDSSRGSQDSSSPNPSEQAFSDSIAREQDFLRALIRIIGVPRSDVQDVLQDSNLYLVKNQSRFEAGTNFRAWAAQVVRYRCLHYFRRVKNGKMVVGSDEVLEVLVAESTDRFEEVQPRLLRLRSCLAKLIPQQVEFLSAVYTEGKSVKEISEEKGQSYVALRKYVSRIRQTLKRCIENHDNEFE